MKITLAKPIQITNQALTRQTPAFAASECSFWSLSIMLIKIFLILQVLIVKTLLIVATTTLWAPWTLYFTNKQKWEGATSYHGQTYIIPVNTPVFPGSLPYFIHLPPPPPVLLFLPGNSHSLYGPRPSYMNTRINILFQGFPVARSCMKSIASHNWHNTQIPNHLWPQPGNLQRALLISVQIVDTGIWIYHQW